MKLTEAQKNLQEQLRAKERARKAAMAEAKRLREAQAEALALAALGKHNRTKVTPLPWSELGRNCRKMVEFYQNKNFATVLDYMMLLPSIRNYRDWKPQGKSAHSIFRSLGNHLFCKYPVPNFLWTAFFASHEYACITVHSKKLIDMVLHIGLGESLYDYLKNDSFFKNLNFSRKMCHTFLKAPAPDRDVIANLRKAQVICWGGDDRFFNALEEVTWAHEITGLDEAFNQGIVQWLIKQPMLDLKQVEPLYDFITAEKARNNQYSLKGRTALSVMKEMAKWHIKLGQERSSRCEEFSPSGVKEATFDYSTEGNKCIWRFREILNSRDLAAEGRRQGHCVYSYATQIMQGFCSIWTLTKEDNSDNWAMLTIEVGNGIIKQMRGRFNRPANVAERDIVNKWCTEAGLTVGRMYW